MSDEVITASNGFYFATSSYTFQSGGFDSGNRGISGGIGLSVTGSYIPSSVWSDPPLNGAAGYTSTTESEYDYFVDKTLFTMKLQDDIYFNVVLMSDGRKRYVYTIDFIPLVKFLIEKREEVIIDDDFSEPYVRNTSNNQPFSIFFTTETKDKKEFDKEMERVYI